MPAGLLPIAPLEAYAVTTFQNWWRGHHAEVLRLADAYDISLEAALHELLAAGREGLERSRNLRIEAGHLAIETSAQRVLWRGQLVPITAKRYLILSDLARYAGHTRSVEQLCLAGWKRPCDLKLRDSLKVHIGHLRALLPEATIATVRGTGYRLDPT